MITQTIRELEKPDCPPCVLLGAFKQTRHGRAYESPGLVVIRNGDTRILKISSLVAEELIAAGFNYGN